MAPREEGVQRAVRLLVRLRRRGQRRVQKMEVRQTCVEIDGCKCVTTTTNSLDLTSILRAASFSRENLAGASPGPVRRGGGARADRRHTQLLQDAGRAIGGQHARNGTSGKLIK